MAGPFLTIYTPTYKRPRLLKRCKQSVKEQAFSSVCAQKVVELGAYIVIQHLIIEDRVGIGIGGMFREIQDHLDEIQGEYVYILQDDDELVGQDVIEKLWDFIQAERNPPVVIVKAIKMLGSKAPQRHVLPMAWEQAPRPEQIDLGNYVVRADVFREHAAGFGSNYDGDFYFIARLWDYRLRFTWLDLVFARSQGSTPGLGRTEMELPYKEGVKE